MSTRYGAGAVVSSVGRQHAGRARRCCPVSDCARGSTHAQYPDSEKLASHSEMPRALQRPHETGCREPRGARRLLVCGLGIKAHSCEDTCAVATHQRDLFLVLFPVAAPKTVSTGNGARWKYEHTSLGRTAGLAGGIERTILARNMGTYCVQCTSQAPQR